MFSASSTVKQKVIFKLRGHIILFSKVISSFFCCLTWTEVTTCHSMNFRTELVFRHIFYSSKYFCLKCVCFDALQAVHSIFNLQKVKKKTKCVCVCVCVCVGGGGGVAGGGGGGRGGREREKGVTSYIWCAELHSFLIQPDILLAPLFFNKKYMTNPIFLDWYMKGPTFQRIDLSK